VLAPKPNPRPAAFNSLVTSGYRSLWGTQKRRGDYGRPNVVRPW
jgi:hypothetical protein